MFVDVVRREAWVREVISGEEGVFGGEMMSGIYGD